MDCNELKQMMDSYISDELLIETNHEVLRHLENCPGCRGELSDRRNLRLRLRYTIVNSIDAQLNPAFAARVGVDLRDRALRAGLWDNLWNRGAIFNTRFLAAGFACLVFMAFGGMIWLNRSNTPVAGGQPQIPQVSNVSATPDSELARAVRISWQEMTGQAVGDHKNCAVKFNLPEKPISLDVAAANYGAFNKALDKTVAASVKKVFKGDSPEGVELLEAHSCIFEGRRFAHIVLRHRGRVVSVLVTDTDLPTGNGDIQTANFDGNLNAAGFNVGHHAVFVVSELSDAENTMMAQAIAPAIRLQTEKVGA